VEWCRADGFHGVVLHASDEGRPLYESMGFQTTNEMRLKRVRDMNGSQAALLREPQ
jgi:hypothetical protein